MQVFNFITEGDSTQTTKFSHEPVNSEYQLESWLHANPNVLLDKPLQIIGRQSDFGTGPIDLLALDQYGNTVVLELKKGDTGSESTSEDRIIGQPVRYAQAVASCDYDDLNDEYQQYQRQLAEGAWSTSEPTTSDQELAEAFEEKFGVALDPEKFNRDQRLVIVAEEITQATAKSARYLLNEGVNIQCREIQQLHAPEGSSRSPVLAVSTVVDYDLSRVNPPERANPAYTNINRRIVDRTFEVIGQTVNADDPDEVFLSGFKERELPLESNHPEHPDSIVYKLRVKPDATPGHVGITIDVVGDDAESVEALQDHAATFEEVGCTVTGNSTHRVVQRQWPVQDVSSLGNGELLDEIAESYSTLVTTGHEVLTEDY